MSVTALKQKLCQYLQQQERKGFLSHQLAAKLNITTDDAEVDFFTALDELIAENKIYHHAEQERYYWMAPNWYYGKLKLNNKGYGFVTLTEDNYQLPLEYVNLTFFVARDSLTKALDGDLVLIEALHFTTNDKMKPAAVLITVVRRQHHFLVGVLKRTYRQKYYLAITNVKFQHYFSHILNVRQQNWPLNHLYRAEIVRVKQQDLSLRLVDDLGPAHAPKSEVKALAAAAGASVQFAPEIAAISQKIPHCVTSQQYDQARLDLRSIFFVTIDGADSKDFDDAINVTMNANGTYCLRVAIADVAEYVVEDSLLDETAASRGCSIYLLGQVLPMLPEALSNGICSLNPNVDRLALMAEMTFDQKSGQLLESQLAEVIINSKARLTYAQVNRFFESSAEDHFVWAKMIKTARQLFHILQANKQRDGYVDFELVEPQYVLNAKDQIIKITTEQRGDAEKMIESFMVAANETVARSYQSTKQPFLYRNHKSPQVEKVNRLRSNLALMGVKIMIDPDNPTPQSYQTEITTLKHRDDFAILGPLFLRSMEKALYEVHNVGHFGLGSTCYTHFTSPIRRYCDLMVHRAIKAWLRNETVVADPARWERFEKIAHQCNETEMIAFDAENAVIAYRTAEYMAQRIGHQYEGVIVTITNFGFFVELKNRISGLVHISTLEDDFYEPNELKNNLIGQRTKKVYRLGQTVLVQVVQADAQQRKIDFTIVS